ncbi:MAG: MFS transporter [Acidimicrobiales bacterium]
MDAVDRKGRLVTPRFALVVVVGLLYFLSLGMLLPTVPQFVERGLGAGDLGVGIVVGAFSVGAVLLRPFAGRVGDRAGRRVLIVGGALIVGIAVAAYHLATGIGLLIAARVLGGIGEAAFFVGAGTMITDLAPEARRGEAISYWSVAVYGGLAFGPTIGEIVLGQDQFGHVWTLSAVLAFAAAGLALFTSETVDHTASIGADGQRLPPAPLLNRSALIPGTVLFLGMIGLAGFAAFVPLYVPDLGMADSRTVFLLYGCLILAIRIFGARIPDRIGPLWAGSGATTAAAAGMFLIAALATPAGLYSGTIVFSVGMSLLYPAMLMLAITDVPARERGSAVGTVSSFFDLSQGLGAVILGGVAALAGYRGAFVAAGVLALVGLAVLRSGADRRIERAEPDHEAARIANEELEPPPP